MEPEENESVADFNSRRVMAALSYFMSAAGVAEQEQDIQLVRNLIIQSTIGRAAFNQAHQAPVLALDSPVQTTTSFNCRAAL